MADQPLNAPSTLPTDREIEEAKGRLHDYASWLDDDRPFSPYDSEGYAQKQTDLFLILSRLSSVEGELAGKQIDSSPVSQSGSALHVAPSGDEPSGPPIPSRAVILAVIQAWDDGIWSLPPLTYEDIERRLAKSLEIKA
jgi:hypothetical protein